LVKKKKDILITCQISVVPVSASYYNSSSSFGTIFIKIAALILGSGTITFIFIVPIPVLEPCTLGLQF